MTMNVYQVLSFFCLFLAGCVQASVPDCGLRHAVAARLKRNTNVDYPWQVAIYKKDQYICGGTLLTPKIVVTAGHCVTSETSDININDFKIFAGKHHLDKEDAGEQSSKVEKVIPHEQFKGQRTNYANDIALLVLSKEFKLTNNVQQVCRDASNSTSIKSKLNGVVSGWGKLPLSSKLNNDLQEINVFIDDTSTCLSALPQEFGQYFSNDKFCAKFDDKDVTCIGLSGSGLFVKNTSDNRYYIKGILSTAPKYDSCDGKYALYTNLEQFDEFINRVVSENAA